jgi:hypothetical protein
MNSRKELPFPRGSTFSDKGGNGIALDDNTYSHLEGQIFETEDTVHGTGTKVKLRVVKNDTGNDITVAKKFCKFSTDALDFGRRIGKFPANAAGAIVKPLDDAYVDSTTIPEDDLFYVVEAGPCEVLPEATITTAAAGKACCTDKDGLVDGAVCPEGSYAVGVLDTTPEGNKTVVVWVNEGLVAPDAGASGAA